MSFYTADSLSFSYGGRSRLFQGISFSIERDEHIGLIGPNGCGKTTLIRLMLGIIKPLEGKLYLEAEDIRNMSLAKIGKKVGYVFQNPEKQLFCPTVREQVEFSFNYGDGVISPEAERRVEYYLKAFDLMEYKDISPMELSHGEKQRTALAAALAREVSFLIFDEPTSGLDVLRKNQLAECILSLKAEGKGYIITGHEARHLERYVDRLLILGPEGVESIG